jgi:hypothetical protein
VQRRAQAGRHDEQQHGDRRGDHVSHNNAITNLVISSSGHSFGHRSINDQMTR